MLQEPPRGSGMLRDAACRTMAAAAVLVLALEAGACTRAAPEPRALTIATTTSVGNSGLLDALATAWQRESGSSVRPHLVGSGRALELLTDGSVSLIISHAPQAEAARIAQHPHWQYRKFMYNDFVLVGPRDDPAQARLARSIQDAMRRIAASGARFLSRGDHSGTHEREQALWKLAGAAPTGDRLVIAGSGMGATLRIAAHTGAYTLSDRATFSQHRPSLPLIVVFEGGAELLNTYAVIWDPRRDDGEEAEAFAVWLSDGVGRDAIAQFGGGGPFRVWPVGQPRSQPSDVPKQ